MKRTKIELENQIEKLKKEIAMQIAYSTCLSEKVLEVSKSTNDDVNELSSLLDEFDKRFCCSEEE